jgi:TolB-like protein
MLRRNLLMALLTFNLILGMGCAYRHEELPYIYGERTYSYTWDGNIIPVSYKIADELITHLIQPISKQESIIVASFVSIDNLNKSSTFGRMIAEQIASRLTQRGYKIQEVKLRQGSILVQEGKGEFLLSRDLQQISKNYNASAVVVGTFAENPGRIYVSARIVRASDGIMISSYDVAIQMSSSSWK